MSPAKKRTNTKKRKPAAKRAGKKRVPTVKRKPSAKGKSAAKPAAATAKSGARSTVIGRLDPDGMGARIEGLGDQLRRGPAIAAPALARIAGDRPARVILCGMGGSAIAGELLASIVDREGATPMHVVRHYEAPGWITPEDFLIFSSYSGETEETLAAYRALRPMSTRACVITSGGTLAARAEADGIPVARIPGGHPPRAALGYSFSTLAQIVDHIGVLAGAGARTVAAAATVDGVIQACARDVAPARNAANTLASRLAGRGILLMASSRTLGVAAVRWKGQFNENAKHVAWVSLLPESNHNEVDGFVHPRPLQERLTAVFLRDPHDHPRVAKRFEWLGAYLKRQGIRVETYAPEGTDPIARLLACVTFGDFTSYYLALRNGMDPSALPGVTQLKKALSS